ncbi:MAG: hypothetical protein HY098_04475 [Nitrospinae bacterium]|nr:hypothetical protein [Nitrospinota bacterium]
MRRRRFSRGSSPFRSAPGLVAASALLAALLASCAAAPVKPAPPTEQQARMLELVSSANPASKAARMSGRVEISSAKGSVRSAATVAVEGPNKMRAVFRDPFGMAWFVLVVNEKTVFYAEPDAGKKALSARRRGVPVNFGVMSAVPEDIINNIRPSFDPRELDGADVSFAEDGLLARWPDRSLELALDQQYRITSAVTRRANGGEIRFEYSYGEGTLGVRINSEMLFEFSRVETLSEAPPALFEPPAL